MYYYPVNYGISIDNSGIQGNMISNYIPYYSMNQVCFNPTFIFPMSEFLPTENNPIVI